MRRPRQSAANIGSYGNIWDLLYQALFYPDRWGSATGTSSRSISSTPHGRSHAVLNHGFSGSSCDSTGSVDQLRIATDTPEAFRFCGEEQVAGSGHYYNRGYTPPNTRRAESPRSRASETCLSPSLTLTSPCASISASFCVDWSVTRNSRSFTVLNTFSDGRSSLVLQAAAMMSLAVIGGSGDGSDGSMAAAWVGVMVHYEKLLFERQGKLF